MTFGSIPLDHTAGTMTTHVTVQAGDHTLYVSTWFEEEEAAVYCESLGYAGGEVYK